MEPTNQIAKLYLDWWEQYWEQETSTTKTIEEMQNLWSAVTQSCEDALKNHK